MRVQSVVVRNGKCIEEGPTTIGIMDFPTQLRKDAALQYIYTAISENLSLNSRQLVDLYQMVYSIDIDPYLDFVFGDKNEDARYLLSLKISNLLNVNNIINLTQESVYAILFG